TGDYVFFQQLRMHSYSTRITLMSNEFTVVRNRKHSQSIADYSLHSIREGIVFGKLLQRRVQFLKSVKLLETVILNISQAVNVSKKQLRHGIET
ncbi:hypothetical protein PMAYCL1PPCAC_25979, partial [Pristionchus mayeri]